MKGSCNIAITHIDRYTLLMAFTELLSFFISITISASVITGGITEEMQQLQVAFSCSLKPWLMKVNGDHVHYHYLVNYSHDY